MEGREFVFRQGTRGKDVPAALKELATHLKGQKGVDPSIRCSTHVHIDVTDINSESRQVFLMMGMLFEDVLYRLGGAERRHNPYCMSISTGGMAIRSFLNGHERDAASHWEKYTSINLRRFLDLGTFEFRTMEGTLDMNRVMSYILVVSRMKDLAGSLTKAAFAKHYRNNPFDLYRAIFDMSDMYINSSVGDYNTAVAKGVALCDLVLDHKVDKRRKDKFDRVVTVRTKNNALLLSRFGIKADTLPAQVAKKLFGTELSKFVHSSDINKVA